MDTDSSPSVFERIFMHALDLLCIAGYDGYFKVVNPAWQTTLGWTTAELLDRPWLEFVHPEDRDTSRNVMSQLRNGQLVFRFENRYFCKDGTIRWLSWDSHPYPEENIIIAVARDVTEVKSAQEGEHLRRDFQQALAEISARLAVLTDHDFDEGVQFALQRLGELLDMDRAYLFRFTDGMAKMDNTYEWCGEDIAPQRNLLQNLPADAFPWWWQQMSTLQPVHCWDVDDLPPEAAAEKQEFQRQQIQSLLCLPMRYPCGKLLAFLGFDSVRRKFRWAEWQIRTLQVVAELLAAAINRLEAFEALRQSEASARQLSEQDRRLFDLNVDGITVFRLTPDGLPGCFLDANPAAAGMLGYSRDEWLCRTPMDLEPAVTDATVRARLAEVKTKGLANIEAVLRTKSGGEIVVEVQSLPILYNGCPAIMNIGRDVTARKQAEAKLAEQFKELQRWHNVTMGRETRVMELKREVNELLARAGLPPKYQSVHDDL
jgi:PAS domain S-box-containing protein